MKDEKQLKFFEGASEGGSIIKVSVSISMARQAVAAFAKNRMRALEMFSHQLRETVSSAINDLLDSEITLFLGQAEQQDNKKNGVREREYYLKGVGKLRLALPRDRKGEFRSVVIPSHERIDPRTKQDLAILHLAGLSNRTLAMISHKLLGIEVSKSTVSESLETMKSAAEDWLSRPLDKRYWALYIDGTNFKIQRKGSTEREPSLCVLGVDENNHRSVLAVEPGTKDNVESWRAAFAELKRRGLDASAVRIGIMDGLPGLESLFIKEFPQAVTQRCFLHVLRNVLAKSPARYREVMKSMAYRMMYAESRDKAYEAFTAFETMFAEQSPRSVTCLKRDIESLFSYYAFDKRFWRALRTTNAIERLNKEFKRRTKSMETLGEQTLMATVAFTALKLELGWSMHAVDSAVMGNLDASPQRQSAMNAIDYATDRLIKSVH